MFHVSIGNCVTQLGLVHSTISSPLQMSLVNISEGISDGRLQMTISILEGFNDANGLRPNSGI